MGFSRLMQPSAWDSTRGAVRRELAPRRRNDHHESDGRSKMMWGDRTIAAMASMA